MALSKGAIESGIMAELAAQGIKTGGTHGKAWVAPKAVADGVHSAVTGTAIVDVPYRAGGSYPVTGLSSGAMSSVIAATLQANGIKFSSEHARANVLPDAVATAVTAQILGSCQATVPRDGIGTFPVTGLSESALRSAIEAQFRAKGLVLTGDHAFAGTLAAAIAKSVASNMNGSATITGNWYYAAGAAPVQ
ncbi:MAG: hypothetical protein ACRCUZ_15330 [Shewanella sp.]